MNGFMNALDPANDPFVKKEQTRQRKIPPGHPYLMKDCEKIKKDKDKNALSGPRPIQVVCGVRADLRFPSQIHHKQQRPAQNN